MNTTNWLPSAAEMIEEERKIFETGLSALDLMNKAGIALAENIYKENYPLKGNILIFCGSGNNGGDGLVIAKTLKAKKLSVQVIIAASKNYSNEFISQLNGTEHIDVHIFSDTSHPPQLSEHVKIIDLSQVSQMLNQSALVIDALLGTGQKGAPRDNIASLCECLAKYQGKIISIDLPTGVNTDTGEVYSPCIKATKTLCIQAIKRGLLQFPAKDQAGQVEVVNIDIAFDTGTEFAILNKNLLPILPEKNLNLYKNAAGSVLVIGGSKEYLGAPLLSAYAALRTGAGIVKVASPKLDASLFKPELIHILGSSLNFSVQDVDNVLGQVQKVDCCVLGPGLGSSQETENFTLSLLEELKKINLPCVLDADCLNVLAKNLTKIKDLIPNNSILTPHPGEAAKLLNIPSAEIQKDRHLAAKNLYELTGTICILKGAQSIVYGNSSNPLGLVLDFSAPYMATAGSGDVLSGICGALLAYGLKRNLSAFAIASLALSLHAQAGQFAHNKHGGPIVASDIIEAIPWVIGESPKI